MNLSLKNNRKRLKLTTLGFTLVELLGVIAVLAVILLVTVPVITGTLQKSKQNEYKRFLENISLATESYIESNRDKLPRLSIYGDMASIAIKDLISFGVVKENTINPQTKKSINDEDIVLVKVDENNLLQYEYLAKNRQESDYATFIGILDEIRITEGDNYDLLNGVSALDNDNNNLNVSCSMTDTSVKTVGTYDIIYSVFTENIEITKKIKLIVQKEYLFDYTGNYQTFTVPANGKYKIELWGAQGGSNVGKEGTIIGNTGGLGAYTSGKIVLNSNDKIYFYVGGQGQYASGTSQATTQGYNGGGIAGYEAGCGTTCMKGAGGGGGATDARITAITNSRIMVAGGGGGAANWVSPKSGGAAGALTGISGSQYSSGSSSYINATGGTQISGGNPAVGGQTASPGTFNNGGSATTTYGGGGGGGYYGGGGGAVNSSVVGSGAGGSSYISGYTGCVAVTSETNQTPKAGCTNGTTDITCSYHYSGLIFTDALIKSGNEVMPLHDGTSTMTGNTGNGYAKITYIGE